METVNFTVRMKRQTRVNAAKLFSELCISTTQAINMFLKRAVREQRISFEVAARPAESLGEQNRLPHRALRPRSPFTPKWLRLCKQNSCAIITS